MSATPAFVATPNTGLVQIVPADASAQKTLFTAGASGAKVTSVSVVSDDTAARVLQLSVLRGGTNYPIATVNVPIGSGSDGTIVSIDMLNTTISPWLPIDNDGEAYLILKSGDVLQVKSLTTVTAAKTITVFAQGGDL